MTIKVTVRNDDTRPDAAVLVVPVTSSGNFIPGMEPTTLHGGDETSYYVHAGNQLLVREKLTPATTTSEVAVEKNPE